MYDTPPGATLIDFGSPALTTGYTASWPGRAAMNRSSPADARQRAHLVAQRSYLSRQADALNARALWLWRLAQAMRAEGIGAQHVEQQAIAVEDMWGRIDRAVLAIDDELGTTGADCDRPEA